MYRCIELAGFAAAQMVCCLFDRQPFVPLAFSRRAPDARTVSIVPGGSPDEIAAQSKRWLDANVDDADEAVIAVDGYVTIPTGRKDAIILELRSYRGPVFQMRLAVPYRPHHDPAGFAIYRPKFIVAAVDGHDIPALTETFFSGVFSHETGGRIWKACADSNW
jgi:hypothetical protein